VQNDARVRPAYPIASVDNALRLVSLIGELGQVRVSEAAEALGTARSTAHRLLAMLEYHGFARRDEETKGYAAGPALIEAGLFAVDGLDLRGVARPILEQLCEQVGETVHLVLLQDDLVVFLDSIETSRGLRIGSRVGRSMPAHCTACGKAILAELSPEALRRLYPHRKLEQMTPQSLSTFKHLELELEAVRERGFATNFGESEDDVAAVAVAVPRQPGMQRASITVSAPLTRMNQDRIPAVAEAARRAADDLSQPRVPPSLHSDTSIPARTSRVGGLVDRPTQPRKT
jgi:IclR family acetate operon transcriptional repressor